MPSTFGRSLFMGEETAVSDANAQVLLKVKMNHTLED